MTTNGMTARRCVIATRNPNKVREITDILGSTHWRLLSMLDFPGCPDIEEDGEAFADNALKKARVCFQCSRLPSMADDSGLEVDALGGAPGVFSSRFAGDDADDRKNNEKLLRLLEDIPMGRRTARFRCVAAWVDGRVEKVVEGTCEGVILKEIRGSGGFGYDPLFFIEARGKTFAEMRGEEKNAISHRGIAFRKMAEWIQGGCV